jgi:hypothetical protein
VSLTREQILAARHREDRKPVKVSVPEWGGDVYLRVMTVADQVALSEDVKPAEMPVQVLLHCLVDENGTRLLEEEDAEALAEEDFPLVLRLFNEAAKLNGLTSKELEVAMASFEQARDEQLSTDSLSLSGGPSQNSKMSVVPS